MRNKCPRIAIGHLDILKPNWKESAVVRLWLAELLTEAWAPNRLSPCAYGWKLYRSRSRSLSTARCIEDRWRSRFYKPFWTTKAMGGVHGFGDWSLVLLASYAIIEILCEWWNANLGWLMTAGLLSSLIREELSNREISIDKIRYKWLALSFERVSAIDHTFRYKGP